ncbi:hypothetical protein EV175_007736, partial [Coemansia sp. RSA 1933]
MPIGRPSTEYGIATSEIDAEISQTDATGVSTKDFVTVQRFIFDHLDRLDTYLAREPMVRLHVQPKASDKRKSTNARLSTAATTAAAAAVASASTSPLAANGSSSANGSPGANGAGSSPSLANGQKKDGSGTSTEAAAAATGEITSTENL